MKNVYHWLDHDQVGQVVLGLAFVLIMFAITVIGMASSVGLEPGDLFTSF